MLLSLESLRKEREDINGELGTELESPSLPEPAFPTVSASETASVLTPDLFFLNALVNELLSQPELELLFDNLLFDFFLVLDSDIDPSAPLETLETDSADN